MPFRQVALYRWADHVGDEHVTELAAALDALAAQVPGVRSVTHGADAGMLGDSFDYVVVVDVDTVASWRALRGHPSYVLLVEELVAPNVAEQAMGQFHLDDRSSVGAGDLDVDDLTDDEIMERARRAAQASMDALMAEPDDVV